MFLQLYEKSMCILYSFMSKAILILNNEKMRGKEKKRERFRRFLQRHYYHFRNKIDPHSSRDK